ncbi:MAG: isopentenyl phosphate kinase family protein [Thermoplasmatales archaeon]|nr:MAG: isopentenyl phosphate kinase family protein [Thermoplasmatales archaeon]
MFIVKLGGSVITDKSKKYFFKRQVMKRLSSELKKANKETLLVHGAGSFGHILAKEHMLNQGYKSNKQLQGFSLTHAMVQKLNSLVLESLHDRGIAAVSIPPHAILKLDDHKPVKMDYNIFREYLDRGFTPLTFGDVVLDGKLGFSICSGDLLLQMLAEHFKPEKVIFVIDEDGLYTSNPKMDKNAKFIEKSTVSELEALTTSSNAYDDVTKGMEGKIETIKHIVSLEIDTIMLNGNIDNRLYDTLIGKESKHTLIYGGKK